MPPARIPFVQKTSASLQYVRYRTLRQPLRQFTNHHPLLVAMIVLPLEDRIRDLCLKAIAAEDDSELGSILTELRGALHEHFQLLKEMLANYPLTPP